MNNTTPQQEVVTMPTLNRDAPQCAQDFTVSYEVEFETQESDEYVRTCLRDHGLPVARDYRTRDQFSEWHVKPDGSVPGWEIVTPILAYDDLPEVAPKLAAALREILDASVSSRCSQHVHVGIFGHVSQQFHMCRNIVRRVVNFEDTFDTFQPVARRGNNCQYARSNLLVFNPDPVIATQEVWRRIENVGTAYGLQRMFNPSGRYYKLNLESLARHGTAEFRQGCGTLDSVDFDMWPRFLLHFAWCAAQQQRLWKRPATHPESVADRFRKITRLVPADVVAYLRSRVRRFA